VQNGRPASRRWSAHRQSARPWLASGSLPLEWLPWQIPLNYILQLQPESYKLCLQQMLSLCVPHKACVAHYFEGDFLFVLYELELRKWRGRAKCAVLYSWRKEGGKIGGVSLNSETLSKVIGREEGWRAKHRAPSS
jgi:hypothetical protein